MIKKQGHSKIQLEILQQMTDHYRNTSVHIQWGLWPKVILWTIIACANRQAIVFENMISYSFPSEPLSDEKTMLNQMNQDSTEEEIDELQGRSS